MFFFKILNYAFKFGREIQLRAFNKINKKNKKTILFYPHDNCRFDGYDIFNGESSNVLCLFNSILQDEQFNGYELYVIYYHRNRLQSYLDYIQAISSKKVHFIYCDDKAAIRKAVFKSYTIFTDSDYTRIRYKVKSQRIICLNYFGGLIKGEFQRWTNNGGFKKMILKQIEMERIYDYHLSISDICSKFIALDNCHYYPHFLSLGFPRNDVFFRNNSELRKQVENFVNFKVERIITYAPTHRDYENPERDFFDSSKATKRSIWGHISNEDLANLEKTLAETNTIIIAKVHPIQKAKTQVISKDSTSHIIFYSSLIEKIKTSLNPLLAISDAIITDYTTTVYDFLYTNRPIIYYFYDIEQYRATRGFFIEPIESICAGHLTYNMQQLSSAIKDIAEGKDPWCQKRKFLQNLFIAHIDGIKEYFFNKIE